MKINKNPFLFYLIIIISITFILLNYNVALAINLSDWSALFDDTAGEAGYETTQQDVESVIATIIQVALTFVGVIFLLLAIYGGYIWMNARGNEEQITKAKGTLRAAIIGLIIVIGAYAISYFVVARLGEGILK